MYLLDTNVWIDFALARVPDLIERMESVGPGSLGMSAITLAELSVGARSTNIGNVARLEAVIGLVTAHPFESRAANVYGDLVRRIGIKRHSFDRLIAAHALALDAVIVTRNECDFADVPGLRVENWTE